MGAKDLPTPLRSKANVPYFGPFAPPFVGYAEDLASWDGHPWRSWNTDSFVGIRLFKQVAVVLKHI